MKPTQLKRLIATLRANGVVSYKYEGLELLLDPNFKPEQKPIEHMPGQLASEMNRASPGFQGMSPDEILFWSAPKTDEAV
jgi:hypothetical protein